MIRINRHSSRRPPHVSPLPSLSHLVARLAGMNEEHREKFIKDLIDDLHHVPLVGRRGCYLHLHANDCGLGLKWDAKDLVRGAVDSEDGLLFNPDTEQLVPVRKHESITHKGGKNLKSEFPQL
jgi:hypothetical protein